MIARSCHLCWALGQRLGRATAANPRYQGRQVMATRGAKLVLAALANSWRRIRLIWADGGHAGQLLDWVRGLQTRRV